MSMMSVLLWGEMKAECVRKRGGILSLDHRIVGTSGAEERAEGLSCLTKEATRYGEFCQSPYTMEQNTRYSP